MARVFQELKIIERWGSGIQRIKEACRNAGLLEPTFEEIGYRFRVTLYRTKSYGSLLTNSEQKIYDVLSNNQGLSTKDIAEQMGLSTRQIRKSLIALLDKGMIVEVKRHLNDPEKKYFIK